MVGGTLPRQQVLYETSRKESSQMYTYVSPSRAMSLEEFSQIEKRSRLESLEDADKARD